MFTLELFPGRDNIPTILPDRRDGLLAAQAAYFQHGFGCGQHPFMRKVQAIVATIARDYEPQRLYVIRIDNWFGPKWMHFAGKFTAGKGAAIGVHKVTLHVPPFVPHRVIAERVFVAPNYDEIVRPPLHIECASSDALQRRIADVDKQAAFVCFSSQSETQRRGSIMVYLPVASEPSPSHRDGRGRTGAFYIGFSQREMNWEPAMLRGVSRGEVAHLAVDR